MQMKRRSEGDPDQRGLSDREAIRRRSKMSSKEADIRII